MIICSCLSVHLGVNFLRQIELFYRREHSGSRQAKPLSAGAGSCSGHSKGKQLSTIRVIREDVKIRGLFLWVDLRVPHRRNSESDLRSSFTRSQVVRNSGSVLKRVAPPLTVQRFSKQHSLGHYLRFLPIAICQLLFANCCLKSSVRQIHTT